MFGFIKNKIKKIYNNFTVKIASIFSRNKLDDQFIKELTELLIAADTGITTTNTIINKLMAGIKNASITDIHQAKEELEKSLLSHITPAEQAHRTPRVVLLVGVNGSGKTTFGGKYANMLKNAGKKVILVAGDTFRAAATQQLIEWGKRVDVPVFVGKENQDPASVIFDACSKFKAESFDHIIIDTAGRLQTKINLMKELEKIRKTIDKQLPNEPVHTWLIIDSMIGQNSLRQAELFHETATLNGIILTKLDGTGKGGIIFAIYEKLHIPILYATYGEQLEDLKPFNIQEYIHELLYEE